MNIAYLCGEYPPFACGGIGTMTRILGRALAERGHHVQVLGCYANQTGRVDLDGPVQILKLPCCAGRFGWLRERYQLYRAVAQLAGKRQIDVLEAPDYQGWTAGWPKLSIPVVVRLHGSSAYFRAEMGSRLRGFPFQVEKAALQRADFVCSTSRYTARRTAEIFGFAEETAHVMYNPVEVPPRERFNRIPNMVVYSGTLAAKKGVVQLIKAWTKVQNWHPEAELHLYGKDGSAPEGGSMHSYLQASIEREGGLRVVFHGHVDRTIVLEALKKARLAVFPSYAEAFALAPLEAMALACPTIYTTRGSGTELIRDGMDGLLVDPDDIDSIAHAISTVLRDGALADRLGNSGRQRVEENFALPVLVARNEHFYEGCIDAFHRH